MNPISTNRIQSLDLLKGLVMIIMALDHTRDYFHAAAFYFNPTDPAITTWPIFLTRWITHYCAPVFCFLAGISAFLVGRKKNTRELSSFLLIRGIWLIIVQMILVNFAWTFDVSFRYSELSVIWSLGISMIVLAALVHWSKTAILVFSILVIFGHNLLDSVHFENNSWWAILHESGPIRFSQEYVLYVAYPLIPWMAVMSLGYYFGALYDKQVPVIVRKKTLTIIGISCIALFIILRWSNLYGDLSTWENYNSASKTLMSFLAVTKYPPSLTFLLMTLGPSFLLLANAENLRGWIVNFFSTFGRVPFFYYIIHLYLIHFLAGIVARLTGYGWHMMVLPDWVTDVPLLKGYGFRLWGVYFIWIIVIGLLYPLCRWFDAYKLNHKEKWWLSYL
ncbi:MAG: heparan-alpha-glucosaminide N-acetyltransferase domain-containing protein [Cyclobacteriaceae bacterium]|nr:heparan-alpha-glucosaminide N-acetyltransferase domain-containing protein [Cyclobacteriaceae bacterium]